MSNVEAITANSLGGHNAKSKNSNERYLVHYRGFRRLLTLGDAWEVVLRFFRTLGAAWEAARRLAASSSFFFFDCFRFAFWPIELGITYPCF